MDTKKSAGQTWISTWLLPIVIGVVSTVAGAIASKLIGHMNKGVALWIWQTVGVDLWLMWFGLVIALLFVFIRSLYRLYHLNNARWMKFHDEIQVEFSGWLKDREQDFKTCYEQNFRDREAAAANDRARTELIIKNFADQYPYRLERLDAKLAAIEVRLQEKA